MKFLNRLKGLGIAVLLVLVGFENALAQDKVSKEELVEVIAASINQQNIDELKPHLSDDFQISGRIPPISIKILEQLVSQLNERVEEYSWKNSDSNSDGTQTHLYHFSYSGLGEREVSFSVNEEGKITALELVKMTVKTMDEPSKVSHPTDKIIEVPFKVKENLMLVEATINGKRKSFIFDSGSPRLILNKKYYKVPDAPETRRYSSLQGVHGNINSLDIYTLSDFYFKGIQMINQKVLTTDLSHLETILETPIAGLIGHEIFKGYDLLFNYSNQTLRLIQPDQTQKVVQALGAQLTADTIPLKMEQHLPMFESTILNQTLTLGLDSGATSNLISQDLIVPLQKSITGFGNTNLSGAEGTTNEVKKGVLIGLEIGDYIYDTIPTIFKDISNLKGAYGDELDGLAGYELLSRHLTLVSFSEKIMYLYR